VQIAEKSQLSFDWNRRERSANRTDDALADLDVAEWERAVIWILLTHPDAVCTDLDRKLVCLRISLRNASQYVSKESPFGLSEKASGKFSEAVNRWRERGIIAARPHKRGTFYRADFGALSEWSRHQTETRESALSRFGSAPECSPVLPGAPPSVSEGMNNNPSINPSVDPVPKRSEPAAEVGAVPQLPEEVWQRECTERQLYEALAAWWVREGLADRGVDKAALIGAVLVCRLQPRSNPQRYVEVCLSRGVDENWQRNARAFLMRCRPRPEKGGNVELTPAVQRAVEEQRAYEARKRAEFERTAGRS
jgi:hypothetical protein